MTGLTEHHRLESHRQALSVFIDPKWLVSTWTRRDIDVKKRDSVCKTQAEKAQVCSAKLQNVLSRPSRCYRFDIADDLSERDIMFMIIFLR